MPCWNAASTVERALASVLDERGIALECVVIDDGSTDGTAAIVRAVAERDPRVVLLRLPENVGVSNARNHGLAAARGEWLAFHDADDRILPGGVAALMRPTADPDVLAVIGQRIWTDGERKWLSPVYDIPDIREPGRKSIATHPGLLYYMALAGKVFHRSLITGLRFEGRVLGDQPWAIGALLRAGDRIEVIADTVYEWSRPRPGLRTGSILTVARGSARGGAAMVDRASPVFHTVAAEFDAEIADEATRRALKRAYFERLVRSDLAEQVRLALDRRDPDTGLLFEALTGFFLSIPTTILASTDVHVVRVLRPPATRWHAVVRPARPAYWRMVRAGLGDDRVTAGRTAWPTATRPGLALASRARGRMALGAVSVILTMVSLAVSVIRRFR